MCIIVCVEERMPVFRLSSSPPAVSNQRIMGEVLTLIVQLQGPRKAPLQGLGVDRGDACQPSEGPLCSVEKHDGSHQHWGRLAWKPVDTSDPWSSPLHLDRLIHQAFPIRLMALSGEHSISDSTAMFSAHHH